MADVLYGFDASLITQDAAGNVSAGVALAVHTTYSGSNPFTATKAVNPVTLLPGADTGGVVVSDSLGRVGFFADGYAGILYLRQGSSSWPVSPTDTSEAVAGAVVGKADKADLVVNILDYASGTQITGVSDASAALTAALAAGGEVLVPAKVTLLVSDVNVVGKRITGAGTICKASAAESALHLKGNGSSVTGLTFAAQSSSGQPKTDIKLGDGATNILISECLFKSPQYSAITAAVDSLVTPGAAYTTRVSGVQIVNNRFIPGTGVYTRPVFLCSVDNVAYHGNVIRGCSYDGLRLRENSGFVNITGNQFIDIGDQSWPDQQTRDAIDTYWSGANLIIANNTIRNCAQMGLDVKGYAPDGTGSNRIIITGNHIYGCRYAGIKLLGLADYDGLGSNGVLTGAVVSNNIVQHCNMNNAAGAGGLSDAAILMDSLVAYITITGNMVMENYGYGIYVHNNTPGMPIAHDIKIVGNTVVNNGHPSAALGLGRGIVVATADWVQISGNTVRNDSTLPNAGAQTVGIYTSNVGDTGYTATARSLQITDNVVRDHASQQVQCEPSNNRATMVATFRDNVLSSVHRGAWQHSRMTMYGAGAPTSAEGAFLRGDRVFNTSPGVDGWVCTLSGTPGTWVELGSVAQFQSIRTVTAAATVGLEDSTVLVNAAGATVLTLPTPVGATGRVYALRNIGAGTATVTPTAGNVDGSATQPLATGAKLTVQSDGANWWSI